jgi:uncharacterized RmlC-like cupin family protein
MLTASLATGTIRVIAADQMTQQTAQTPRMVRHEPVSRPGAFGTWIGTARTAPGVVSGWHHHGDHDSYLFVRSGRIRMEFGPSGAESCEAREGDFLHVPKGAIHRESNPGDAEQVMVVIRVGSGDPVFNVDGPGT